jgi:transcriptional regulator of NAD metabolism
MNPLSRRNEILEMLHSSHEPVSASSLAEKFNVSRQIIVGDVAILRAEGQPVMATPRGYILEADVRGNFGYVGTVAVRHRLNRLQEELYIIVDYGGTVIDVTIEHPIYGELTGPLNVSSRYEVDMFVEKVKADDSQPLSTLTDGIHTHRIGCKNLETFENISAMLKKAGLAL